MTIKENSELVAVLVIQKFGGSELRRLLFSSWEENVLIADGKAIKQHSNFII